ncbi:MAG: hypothetical protein JO147_09635 [Actinobacteria bacterium]|nr:hypothetical protein [Actinomycetota bacterium]
MDNRHTLTPLFSAARDEIRDRRKQRATRRALERQVRELATSSDLRELEAILRRHDETATGPVRDLLYRYVA